MRGSRDPALAPLPLLPLLAVGLIAAAGIFRAFQGGGGNDFSVFHEAWSLVLSGRGMDIYRATRTDRFLYAPGFAWILSPLGLLPRNLALMLWSLFKAFVLGFVLRSFGERVNSVGRWSGLTIAAIGALLVARPLIIDFQYGQVNLLILGACLWALLGHFRREEASLQDALRWFVLAVAAMTKLFALPLLVVPWVSGQNIPPKRLRLEKIAVIAGVLAMALLPILSLGFRGAIDLHYLWRDALIAKGLPVESHNQSFTALLLHYFSGDPTPIIAEGRQALPLGHAWLSHPTIMLLSFAWTFMTFGFALGWIFSGARQAPLKWIAVSIGLLIVPSHLVWKPYFVLSMPLAILLVRDSARRAGGGNGMRRLWEWLVVAGVFLAINFTGFDFVGQNLGAHFEAASLFLIVHFVVLGFVLFAEPAPFKTEKLKVVPVRV